MKKLFQQAMQGLSKQVGPDEYRRWLAPLKYHSGNKETLTIQLPNIFFKKWITDHYVGKIRTILNELAGRDIRLIFVCGPLDVRNNDDSPAMVDGEFSPDGGPESNRILNDIGPIDSGLNPKYNFSNFVVGASNQLAHAASLAVANYTSVYNPLFIYGGSGLGKTHLLNAIGNHMIGRNPNWNVVYRSSEQFTNELIDALRTERMSDFRKKYRNIDALFIDDIHFIGGKERTQEEFFYTFNALYETDKQIVLSSDKIPKEIPDLEDRLRSRFEGGLFADISPPDQETKVAILSKKAEEEDIPITTDVAFYLASQNETNIRVLEGYLARLGAYASLTRQPVDLDMAKKLLGMFIEADQNLINLDHILRVTANYFNVKVSDLKSSKKQKIVAVPRQAAMYLARQLTPLSTIEIGRRLGGRDHSTVIHAVKKVENLMSVDSSYSRTIADLEKAIKAGAARADYSHPG